MTDTETPKPLNRRQQAKARTRQKVLDAARFLFERGGYEKATIREIAKEAGMSTGAVFANFEDKAALYEALHGHQPIPPEEGARLFEALRRMRFAAVPFLDDEDLDRAKADADGLIQSLPHRFASLKAIYQKAPE